MADPNKVFTKNLGKKNLNVLFFTFLMAMIVGVVWMAMNDVEGGIIYSLMIFGMTTIFVLILLFLSNDETLKPITNYAKIPISTSLPAATLFFLIAFFGFILIKLLLNVFASVRLTAFTVPLFGSQIQSSFQSFSAAEIAQNRAWELFTVVFTAGGLETFVFNFGMMLAGIFIGWGILKLINDGKDIGFISKRVFIVGFALIFSSVTFMLVHFQNQTYSGAMFWIAAAFMFITNLIVYRFGVFLMAIVGYHMANNLVYLIETRGIDTVAQGFVSWFGLLFGIYMLLLMWYVVRNWKKSRKALLDWSTS